MSDPDIICISSDDDDQPGPSSEIANGKNSPGVIELEPTFVRFGNNDKKSSSTTKPSVDRSTNSCSVKTYKAKGTGETVQTFTKQRVSVNLPNSSLPTKPKPEPTKTDNLVGFSPGVEVLDVEEILPKDEGSRTSLKPTLPIETQQSKMDALNEAPTEKDAPESVTIPSKDEFTRGSDAKSSANDLTETKTEIKSDQKCTNSGPFTIIHTGNFDAKLVGTSLVDLFIGAIQPVLQKSDFPVIQKLRKHASAANPEALSTPEFNSTTQTLIKDVSQDPSNVFVYTKKLLDQLKGMRSTPRSPNKDSASCTEGKTELPSKDGNSTRTQQRIVKLERFLVKLSKKIKEFSEKEISTDEETGSNAYIIESRLQERFMKVTKKICELKNAALDADRIIDKKIKFEGTRYPEINKAITRLLKRGPDMPDYHDVLATLKRANEIHNIHLTERMIEDLAPRVFESVGEEFQKRRKKDLYLTMQTFKYEDIDEEDPAEKDTELLKKLIENRQTFKHKENEVIEKYAEKQTELKEESQEVIDGEEEITSEGDEDEEESGSVVELGNSEDGDDNENETEEEEGRKSSVSTRQRKSLDNGCNGNDNKLQPKRRASESERNNAGLPSKVPRVCISD